MVIVQGIVLVALIKILIETEDPKLCAGIYTGLLAVILLLFGTPWLSLLLTLAISGAYCFAYFWLLARFLGAGMIWWLILIAGIIAPTAAQIALG